MRKYKFRAWCEALKKMDYSTLNSIGFDGRIYYGNADISGFHNDIMQYIGVDDVNGKEIYEKDIVKHHGMLAVIVFHKGMYCFKWVDGRTDKVRNRKIEPIFDNTNIIFEVVGNVYESPEYLVEYMGD